MRYSGPPRRLVDLLNAIDVGYVQVFDGCVDNPAREAAGASHFEVAQVRKDAILCAVPRDDGPAPGTPMEAVHKVPVPACVALPGYDVTGNFYLVPDADPAMVPVLGSKHFVPMTDVVITPLHQGPPARERLVIVNLARALAYAPNPRRA